MLNEKYVHTILVIVSADLCKGLKNHLMNEPISTRLKNET